MATYGPNNGFVPFTGFSPTLGINDAVTPATSGAVWNNGMTQQDNDVSRAMFTGWNRGTRALLLALLGFSTGNPATAGKTWVQGQQIPGGSTPQGGGIVQLANVAFVARNTTAADIINLQAMITHNPAPSVYPPDLSGNGGGSKLGW